MDEAVSEREWMLPEEALPVRLMATIWADVAGVHDDLDTAEDLTAWLDAVDLDRAGRGATAAELALARRLRDAVRRLAAHVTGDERDAARSAAGDVEAAVRDVNDAVAHLPVPRIAMTGAVLRATSSSDSSAITAALARVADESIALLGGPEADKLRACYAPGCVLYFVKTHPRREWCSVTCGNRVRAARHYDKVRSAR
ncbi:ABATE domain-containing protein [Catenulispora sp. NF23]|uniref:CGNR zinc finger domain-containing protein n=1 Tax=Catenulispora pinistramenti TaxID=2705254 RepID=UPI001BACF3A7|nr:ABATE domain-containing protein [Catenulispora pinistramenti]MBS2533679.1 ABATE domain-containing protein [Catenulispora pinistramenti]